jgi:hypothetical protein
MSIECRCPNGHVLKVKNSLAGTSGLCPVCRARVVVPQLRGKQVSEDAILDMLGWHEPAPHADTTTFPATADTTPLPRFHERGTPRKSCYRCNHEIPSGSHICPHCHTYIANLDDF